MHNFYPGPSKIHPFVPEIVAQGFEQGFFGFNHRSVEFGEVMHLAIESLKVYMNIPEEYQVFFTSSATECWEIIAQSLVVDSSAHIYNGAFGEKWCKNTQNIGLSTTEIPFGLDEYPMLDAAITPDVVCLTDNETSNGYSLNHAIYLNAANAYENSIIAVDATSSMMGKQLPWHLADIWFASVQKCFGLPAGLAVMVCSPKCIDRVEYLGHKMHYNSLYSIWKNALNHQTTHTPNAIGIYILSKICNRIPPLEEVEGIIKARANEWYHWFDTAWSGILDPLVRVSANRSDTVWALRMSPEHISDMYTAAKQEGLILGKGYGVWKPNTFRIANFPAHTDSDFVTLYSFLDHYKHILSL